MRADLAPSFWRISDSPLTTKSIRIAALPTLLKSLDGTYRRIMTETAIQRLPVCRACTTALEEQLDRVMAGSTTPEAGWKRVLPHVWGRMTPMGVPARGRRLPVASTKARPERCAGH